jgi:soluble lytic murein transglycosylase-like protein
MAMLRIVVATLVVVALPAIARAPVEEPLPPPLQSLAPPPALSPLDRPVAQSILAFVRRVNPDVPEARAAALTTTILAVSEEHGLDPLLLTGIMAQESHFHADVQSCLGRGCDLGVAQVNWETWGAELKLDRQRLIHDDAYNIGVAADILVDVRRRFGDESGRWWTRYHDRRPDRRAQYADLVRAHAPVLLGSL